MAKRMVAKSRKQRSKRAPGKSSRRRAKPATVSKEVRVSDLADPLRIVDASGHVLMAIGVNGGQPTLETYNKNGARALALTCDGDGWLRTACRNCGEHGAIVIGFGDELMIGEWEADPDESLAQSAPERLRVLLDAMREAGLGPLPRSVYDEWMCQAIELSEEKWQSFSRRMLASVHLLGAMTGVVRKISEIRQRTGRSGRTRAGIEIQLVPLGLRPRRSAAPSEAGRNGSK